MALTQEQLAASTRKQYGAVIIFKDGVTPEQAAQIIESISGYIEMPDPAEMIKWNPKLAGMSVTRIIATTFIRCFNPDWGSPVWYVP
jgi:hypothetical protein